MNINFRKALYWFLRPALRLILHLMPKQDPWERFEYPVPLWQYGAGNRHDFDWYFEGDSAVEIKTLEELQDWLIGCEYAHDMELFHEPDFWQHPRTFERLRRGDCEDHALWAWRKLLELGFDAELVSGRTLPWQPGVKGGENGHVWVMLRSEGGTFVLEAVAKTRERMLQPLAKAIDDYRPEFGVDRKRKRFAFNGFILTLREREFGTGNSSAARRTA
jgi:hypothetical protein